eukprot:2066494-Alexandrium_andersonii.AAC.1
MLQVIEGGAHWPKDLRVAKCSFLGKGEGLITDPRKQRGLMLLSLVYRTWAKCRLRDLSPWYEGWRDQA